jgi:tetratricopeptide (TPR) repeat protein
MHCRCLLKLKKPEKALEVWKQFQFNNNIKEPGWYFFGAQLNRENSLFLEAIQLYFDYLKIRKGDYKAWKGIAMCFLQLSTEVEQSCQDVQHLAWYAAKCSYWLLNHRSTCANGVLYQSILQKESRELQDIFEQLVLTPTLPLTTESLKFTSLTEKAIQQFVYTFKQLSVENRLETS